MMNSLLPMVLLCGIVGCSSGKLPPGPPPLHHNVHFWYGKRVDPAILPALHAIGVQAAYMDGFPSTAVMHAAGVGRLWGFGGTLPMTPAAVAAENAWAKRFGMEGVDFVYVDEPRGPAAVLAQHYNALFDIYRQAYRAAHQGTPMAGICQDSGSFHNGLFAAGLRAEFACLETYSGDTAADVAEIKSHYPAVKIMMLSHGRSEVCDPTIWQNNQITYWGFWDVPSWPADAIAIAKGGC